VVANKVIMRRASNSFEKFSSNSAGDFKDGAFSFNYLLRVIPIHLLGGPLVIIISVFK